MSTTNPPSRETYECTVCGIATPAPETIEGNYCSRDCYHRKRGQRLLNLLRHDHRYCYTCFRQRKTIDRPNPSAPDCVIGFEYPTQHATTGQITDQIDEYRELVRMGTICRCGNTDHTSREAVIQDQHFRQVVANLYYALEAVRQEGQHEHQISITALADALRDQKHEEGWDFALAVGRAVVEDSPCEQ